VRLQDERGWHAAAAGQELAVRAILLANPGPIVRSLGLLVLYFFTIGFQGQCFL